MAFQDTLDQLNDFDISNIDWSRVGVWPFLGRLFVWVVAIVAILAATYFFFIKDMHTTLEYEAQNEQSLRKTFQEKAFQAATLEKFREVMAQMEKDFDFLVAQLPKKTAVPGLLDDIDEKGRDSGLNIGSIKLQPEVVGEFYVELPIEIIVTGTYHDLGTFVSGIAGMSRIVTLHDFKISSKKGSSGLEMTINAKTYRSLDEGNS